MLSSWLELPGAADTLGGFSERAGLDLAALGTTGSAEDITDTAVTQPLLVASALLGAQALAGAGIPADAPAAGHSVGELAAAAVAGVLDPAAAVELAAVRGRAMGQACAAAPTGMAAVLGGDPEAVQAEILRRDLVPANVNGAGQLVVAGPIAAVRALADAPPAGTRVIPLSVAGAFHTEAMAPARETLASAVADIRPADPTRPLLTNADGSVVRDGGAFLHLLVAQVTSPVRWDRCMDTLVELGVTGVLELPPGGTLTGLVKRHTKGSIATMAVRTPQDLEAAAAFAAEHAGAPAVGAGA
jgi:[acyl-carrier-protein] S-malonyltransferase